MAQHQYANNPSTTLSGAITAVDTSISVGAATGFPSQGKFTIIVDSEIMLVTGVAGTVWTVTRATEGTTAAAHASAATVTQILTKSSFLDAHWFDVRNYGATGDGATDDTAAIQAAITAALGGGTVMFPPGTYIVSSPLTVTSSIHLQGRGTSSAIKRGASMTDHIIDGTADTVDVTISDLTLDGNRGSTSGNLELVSAQRPLRWRIERCKITSSPANAPGIQLKAGTDNIISNCHFDTLGYGAVIGTSPNSADACDRNAVIGCTFADIDLNGIFFTGSLDSTVSTSTPRSNAALGNSLLRCGDAAIESGIGCWGTVISGNRVDGDATGTTGILVRDNVASVVTGNYVERIRGGSVSDGISIIAQHTENADIVIGPNSVRDCERDGLHIQDGIRISVSGGEYAANTRHGVALLTLAHFLVSGTVARSNGGSGFRIGESTAAVNNGTLIGCIAFDNSETTTTTADGFVTVDAATTEVIFVGCQAYDTRTGAARRQRYGFNLSAGSNIQLAGSQRAVNNITANINNAATATRGMIAPISSTATGPVGAVTNKVAVYNAEGTLLGYVPVYDAIT